MKRFIALTLPLVLLDGAWAEPLPTSGFTYGSFVPFGQLQAVNLTGELHLPTSPPAGILIVYVLSGGWVSATDPVSTTPDQVTYITRLRSRGFTVFAIGHVPVPAATIPEIALQQLPRAIRFARSQAAGWNINASRIGVTGVSSGGHLALMLGVGGDDGNPSAPDPVDRLGSRVQAVSAFAPVTDAAAYGFGTPATYPYLTHDPSPGPSGIASILLSISPAGLISAATPPVQLNHDPADPVVPIAQSQSMLSALQAAGTPSELNPIPGIGHVPVAGNFDLAADWFDLHLRGLHPPTVTAFGTGTPSCAGAATLGAGSPAVAGNGAFSLIVSNAPPDAAAFLVLGSAPDVAGNTTYGFALHVVLGRAAVFPIGFTDASGDISLSAPLPSSAAGAAAVVQVVLVNPPGCGPGFVSATNALTVAVP